MLLLFTFHCIIPPDSSFLSQFTVRVKPYNGLFSPLSTASLITHSFPDSPHSNPTGFLIVPCTLQAGFYLRLSHLLFFLAWCSFPTYPVLIRLSQCLKYLSWAIAPPAAPPRSPASPSSFFTPMALNHLCILCSLLTMCIVCLTH